MLSWIQDAIDGSDGSVYTDDEMYSDDERHRAASSSVRSEVAASSAKESLVPAEMAPPTTRAGSSNGEDPAVTPPVPVQTFSATQSDRTTPSSRLAIMQKEHAAELERYGKEVARLREQLNLREPQQPGSGSDSGAAAVGMEARRRKVNAVVEMLRRTRVSAVDRAGPAAGAERSLDALVATDDARVVFPRDEFVSIVTRFRLQGETLADVRARLELGEGIASRYKRLKEAAADAIAEAPGCALSSDELRRCSVDVLEDALRKALARLRPAAAGQSPDEASAPAASDAALAAAQDAIDQLKQKCRAAYRREEGLINEVAELRARVDRAERAEAALESDLRTAHRDLESERRGAEEASAAAEEAQDRLEDIQDEMDEAQSLIERCERLERGRDRAEQRSETLEQRLREESERVDALQRRVTDRESALAAARADLALVRRDEEEAAIARRNLESVLESFQQERRAESDAARARVEALERKVEAAEGALEAARQDARGEALQAARDEIRGRETAAVAARLENVALQKGLDQAVARLNKVYFAAEDTVEKALVHKLLMNYFEQGCSDDVLEAALGVLGLPAEQQEIALAANRRRIIPAAPKAVTHAAEYLSSAASVATSGLSWLRRGGPRAGDGANSGPSRAAARDAATANSAESIASALKDFPLQ
jgi:hypothetical protein